jgi:cell wall-associated NlpC family hydrolase
MTTKPVRQRVIDFAKDQAYAGAHYLWGSQGGTPTSGREVKFNPKSLNPATVSFCAARCERDGIQVCGGRYMRRKHAAGEDTPTSASSAYLKQWIADNGSYGETNWDDSLTPRLQKGTGVPEMIVWGEGCDDTRHFDCISFVNWCFWQVRAQKPTFDMYHYFYSIEERGAVTATDVTDEPLTNVQPADLLLYGTIVNSSQYFADRIKKERDARKDEDADADQAAFDNKVTSKKFMNQYHVPVVPKKGVGVGIHHIAFATGQANGRVHASDNNNGVIIDTWGDPVRRIRLPDSFFM